MAPIVAHEHIVDGDVLLRVIHAGEGSTMIEVPNEMVGRIIGKAGAAVKGIQQLSGASVDIPKDTGANSRYLTLVGNAQQMATAQTLIIEKMEGVRADTYGVRIPSPFHACLVLPYMLGTPPSARTHTA